MKTSTLIEVLDASHLTWKVKSEFEQRGGLMLVGPPGSLKTSILEVSFSEHPSALILSDLNVNSVMSLRESLIAGRYKTIVFPEYEKLYQRKQDTAKNLEGVIKQLVEEGFTRASFEEQDAICFKARTLVVGAMTHQFYTSKVRNWSESGFKRRFLWVAITPDDSDAIMKAIRQERRLPLDGILRRNPGSREIEMISTEQAKELEGLITGQWQSSPYILLKKIASVLLWKYKQDWKTTLSLMREFGEGLGNSYALLEISKL